MDVRTLDNRDPFNPAHNGRWINLSDLIRLCAEQKTTLARVENPERRAGARATVEHFEAIFRDWLP